MTNDSTVEPFSLNLECLQQSYLVFQYLSILLYVHSVSAILLETNKGPNTTIADSAHNEPSHLDLQCLSSSL